jgi:hypothetical protein
LPAEKFLLASLARGDEDRAGLASLEDEDLRDLASAGLLMAARDLARRGIPITAASLASEAQDDASRRMLNEIAVEESPAGGQSGAECLRELRRLSLERRLEEVQKRLRAAGAEEDVLALLLQKQDLTRQMAAL